MKNSWTDMSCRKRSVICVSSTIVVVLLSSIILIAQNASCSPMPQYFGPPPPGGPGPYGFVGRPRPQFIKNIIKRTQDLSPVRFTNQGGWVQVQMLPMFPRVVAGINSMADSFMERVFWMRDGFRNAMFRIMNLGRPLYYNKK